MAEARRTSSYDARRPGIKFVTCSISEHDRNGRVGNFVFDFLSGGVSAAVGKTVFAPIERVKIVLQTQDANPQVASGQHARFRGVVSSFHRMYKEQGLAAFWRGNSAAVLRAFPTQALNFGFWGLIRSALPARECYSSAAAAAAANIAGGALAGAMTTVIVQPLDMARTRMAADLKAWHPREPRPHLLGCLREVVMSGGVRSMYSGIAASIVGIAVYRGLYFGMFETLKMARDSRIARATAEAPPSEDDYALHQAPKVTVTDTQALHEAQRLGEQWIMAQTAALMAGFCAYPFDSIRHRMMVQAASKNAMYSSSWDCARKVLRTKGVGGFYQGVTLSLLNWSSAAILLMINDELHRKRTGK